MMREIVLRVDVRAAALILVCILVLLALHNLVQPPRLETYLLVDNTCPACMAGLRDTVKQLSRQGIDLGKVVELDVWGAGKGILKEINASIAPLIVFKGDIDPRILPLTVKVGEYYVLRPTWPVRAFNPEGKRVDIYIHANDMYAEFLRYHIMRTVPNAVVHILPPERDYIVLLEVPKDDVNLIRTAVRTDSEIRLEDKVLLGTKRSSNVVIDVFITSLGKNSRRLVDILNKLKHLFGNAISVIPHYRFAGSTEGYSGNYCLAENLCAPRGPPEVLQNLLETCVYIKYGEANWLSFALSTQHCEGNVSCTIEIAKSMGMDVNTLSACIQGEGVNQAMRDLSLSRTLGISVVPTTFVGGWYPIVGVQDENVYVEAICGMLRADLCPR